MAEVARQVKTERDLSLVWMATLTHQTHFVSWAVVQRPWTVIQEPSEKVLQDLRLWV
tara:strand:- start:566 stop:736 length:171 start_codon:yes stop_codon:yes gene_type:complete